MVRKGEERRYLIEAPQEHPEVVVGEAGDEGARDRGRVVMPSQIFHGGRAVGLRVPLFLGLGGCEGMAVCRLFLWRCVDGFHGLDRLNRFKLWSDGVIISPRGRQRRLFISHWCCAFHSGKYKVILC